MPKTKINKLNRKFKKDVSLTRKNKLVKVSKNNLLLNNFEKEIVVLFLEVLIMVKLFHWKTYSYDTHIPLLFYGMGIPKGSSVKKVNIVDIAPTISLHM